MKKIIYAIFAGVLLVAVSCVEEESPETYLQIVQSDIDFDAAGGSGEILISTNAASVGASSDKSWVTVDGMSSESVRFTVSSSDREFSRVANLTITADGVSQEVTISQMGLIFDITSDELSDGLEIAAAGGSVSFTYSTTGEEPVITIPETDNWLSCTVADGTVTLSAEVNLSGADRSTEVSVAAGWKTMSLSVSQTRVPLLEQTEFSFSLDIVQILSSAEIFNGLEGGIGGSYGIVVGLPDDSRRIDSVSSHILEAVSLFIISLIDIDFTPVVGQIVRHEFHDGGRKGGRIGRHEYLRYLVRRVELRTVVRHLVQELVAREREDSHGRQQHDLIYTVEYPFHCILV